MGALLSSVVSSERPLLIAIALAALGCSLSRPDLTECSSSSRCREVFGPGYVCSSDGFCERAAPNPRCAASYPADVLTRSSSYPGAILIGSLMDRSVTTHLAREGAIRLATTQVGEAGGLEGDTLGVVHCDIAENPAFDSLDRNEAAVAGARYLADAIGVPAIVGPSASTDAVDVYQALAGRDVVLISPSATSTTLSGLDGKNPTDASPGKLWRTAPPDTLQGGAIALYLQQQKVTWVELVVEKGAYGEGLADVFEKAFESVGGTANRSTFITASERDAAVVGAGKTSAPWVLFVSSQTADTAAFVNAAATLAGYTSKYLFLSDSAANVDFLSKIVGSAPLFGRVRGSRFAVPQGAVYEQFRASFNAAFQADANEYSYVAHSYDATWMLFYGAARSRGREGLVHGLGIARGLRRLSSGKPVAIQPSTWPSIRAELAQGGSVDVTGASGALDYDPLTEETRAPVEIWKIAAGGTGFLVEQTLAP